MLRWLFWFLFLPFTLPFRAVRALLHRALPCTALDIRLKGALPDVGKEGSPFGERSTPLLTLLSALASAETDPKLTRVLIHVESFSGGLGRAEELRSALSRIRALGKEVIVFADHLSLAGYWVALGATKLHLSPSGSLEVTGIASEFMLFKGLLDKAGVTARLAAKGKYKSMREVFASEQMSDANREMLEALVSDLYRQLEVHIAEGRPIVRDDVRAILDQGPFRATEAARLRLVDELRYEADVRDELKKMAGFRTLPPARYLARRSVRWVPRRLPRVALVEVDGSIRMGNDAFGPTKKRATGAQSFVRAMDRIAEDSSIRAILLRVDSPGGSALASDLMWHALARARKDRPLFVSMANVAASGGYYVSAVRGARIYANPSALTGSIGVVGGKFEASRLFEKLGIGHEFVSIGRHATYHSPSRDFTQEELAKLESDIDALYRDFVTKMSEGRRRDFDAMERVAQGRVWTGASALPHGLVDELGGLRDALDGIRRELGMPKEARIALSVASRPGLVRRLRMNLERSEASGLGRVTAMLQTLAGHGFTEGALLDDDSLLEPLLETLSHARSNERMWLRMPFDFRWF